MAFVKGDARINRSGRPLTKDTEKPTNRSIRNKLFLQLLRRFMPLQSKAIQTAVKIMDGEASSEAGKLKASALIISTYQQLLKETYDYRYDEEENELPQEENKPVFSLKMISGKDKD